MIWIILSKKLQYKQTFAIVCSFMVVNKLCANDSSISPDSHDEQSRQYLHNLSFVGSGTPLWIFSTNSKEYLTR